MDYLPDAVTDTTRRRCCKAAGRVAPNIRRVRQQAAQHGLSAALILVTRHMEGMALYNRTDHEAATTQLGELLSGAPAYYKLEGTAGKTLHVHAITSASLADDARAAGWHVDEVYDVQGIARYLSKPADSRACRLNHHREAHDPRAAARDYLAAQLAARSNGHKRLPNMHGMLNVPRHVPQPLPAQQMALVLCVYSAVLQHHQQRAAAARMARRRRIAALLARRRRESHNPPPISQLTERITQLSRVIQDMINACYTANYPPPPLRTALHH